MDLHEALFEAQHGQVRRLVDEWDENDSNWQEFLSAYPDAPSTQAWRLYAALTRPEAWSAARSERLARLAERAWRRYERRREAEERQ